MTVLRCYAGCADPRQFADSMLARQAGRAGDDATAKLLCVRVRASSTRVGVAAAEERDPSRGRRWMPSCGGRDGCVSWCRVMQSMQYEIAIGGVGRVELFGLQLGVSVACMSEVVQCSGAALEVPNIKAWHSQITHSARNESFSLVSVIMLFD